VLFGYPTAISLLAQEQKAGRLKINPLLVSTAGERLAPAARTQIKAAFNCLVRESYGASEFPCIAFECSHGWLHVNTDWVILEPVDEAYQPVPAGQLSHTVLVTNLANRVQPLIRYDLGDRVTIRPDPCRCGSPLLAIQVEGRQDDILFLQTPGGETVPLLPLALATVVEETPGVQRFQVIQIAPTVLRVRLEAVPVVDRMHVWEDVVGRLREYLVSHGLSSVSLEYASELPSCDPISGKFRQVWAEWKGMK
jgi:phenylacetate-CoA ligase